MTWTRTFYRTLHRNGKSNELPLFLLILTRNSLLFLMRLQFHFFSCYAITRFSLPCLQVPPLLSCQSDPAKIQSSGPHHLLLHPHFSTLLLCSLPSCNKLTWDLFPNIPCYFLLPWFCSFCLFCLKWNPHVDSFVPINISKFCTIFSWKVPQSSV
jgi:hypothetical protein